LKRRKASAGVCGYADFPLVVKAHRLVNLSTLGLGVIKKKKKKTVFKAHRLVFKAHRLLYLSTLE